MILIGLHSIHAADEMNDICSSVEGWAGKVWEGNELKFSNSTNKGILLDYKISISGQWVQISKILEIEADVLEAVQFAYTGSGSDNTLEIKLVDNDNSTFGVRYEKSTVQKELKEIKINKKQFKYWWGGDRKLDAIREIYIAISGTGNGQVAIKYFKLEIKESSSVKENESAGTARIPEKSLAVENWDRPELWEVKPDNDSKAAIESSKSLFGQGLKISYALREHQHGWVEVRKTLGKIPAEEIPIVFLIKATPSASDLEIKFIDADGSIYRHVEPLSKYKQWTQIVVYKKNVDYCWGGKDTKFDGLKHLEFAISGKGKGIVYLDEVGFGSPGLEASFPLAGPQIDPQAELKGFGFQQRRAREMIPEDPLVLEWLKQIQDTASKDQWLLSSMENNEAQTFNHALIAMAFIVKGEKERAERILDFFARATVTNMWCRELQNFFYKGEARGFYQSFNLNTEHNIPGYCSTGKSDRWMGDMAWLLIAYKYYEKKYGPSRYKYITGLLKNLLIEWYVDANDGPGGYVQHGWRNNDKKLHESFGHPEGNIDAYAVFKLCGENKLAEKIKTWLKRKIDGQSLPLDLYTWQVLAFGREAVDLLNIPEYDLRYRKILDIKGQKVMGLYHEANNDISNIWLDGTGHIACAYIAYGDKYRGYFYTNQLDALIIEREIKGLKTHALPYTANQTGGYDWVKLDRGFVSVACWYIFAKNKFNPLTLEKFK